MLSLYVRAGAILPEQPVVQNTDEKPNGPLELRVYPGDDCRGSLYLDDGHTFAYRKGEFLRVNYSCQPTPRSLTVTSSARQGKFAPWWTTVQLKVFGVAQRPEEVRVGERLVSDWSYDITVKAVVLTLPDSAGGWQVRLTY